MKKTFYHFLVFFITLLTVPACSSRMFEAFKHALDLVTLKNQTAFVLVSNSSTANQLVCTSGNSVVINKTYPASRTLYCRDLSKLQSKLKLGETCPGGPVIRAITSNSSIQECKKLSLCGVIPSSVLSIGEKEDGSHIEQLKFENLPWGCDANLEFSYDPKFSDASVGNLKFYVQPPDCPFCARQNKATCLPCTDLTNNEIIHSGQIVFQNCNGGACAHCENLNESGEFTPHGEGKVYYQSELYSCGQKCNLNSLLRICNNGFWQGDPSYDRPQCFDTACGCTLPNDTITYSHGASKTIYKNESPACGVECNAEKKDLKCNDGTWETLSPIAPFTDFQTYPAKFCNKKICHCVRPERVIVSDGQTRNVYSKNPVSCTETCNTFQGAVTCQAGTLSATNPAFLNYAHDSCAQVDCGCQVPVLDGPLYLANGGSRTLYQYAVNTSAVPDACTNPIYRTPTPVTCLNQVLSSYDTSTFKYKTCTTVPLSCTFTESSGNAINVPSGSSLPVSVNNNPVCGETCQNLTIKCENIVFKKLVGSSWIPVPIPELQTYHYASSCSPKNCDCHLNGHVIPYNGSVSYFYKIAQITNCNSNGCNQARATISCDNAGLHSDQGDDPNLYGFRTCEFIPCGCPVPWGGSIENGRTIKIFSINTANCTAPTACSDANNFRSVTCSNGQLTTYDANQFHFPSCSPPICHCTYQGIQTPFNGTLKVFTDLEPPAAGTCNSISAILTCQPGGSYTGAEIDQYPYVTCTDLTDDGSGGGTGGGTGNDEGPGAGIKKRLGVSDSDGGAGGPCLSFQSCRYQATKVYIPQHTKKACLLPWAGGEIEYYASISAFNTQCVTLPGKCSQHRIVRTCHYPKWTGADEYRYPSCEEKAVCP